MTRTYFKTKGPSMPDEAQSAAQFQVSADQQAAVRDACRPHLPDGPFTLPAPAWYARGLVPPPRTDRRALDRYGDPA